MEIIQFAHLNMARFNNIIELLLDILKAEDVIRNVLRGSKKKGLAIKFCSTTNISEGTLEMC